MTAKQIKNKIEKGENLIVFDIRSKKRFDTFHIPTAKHVIKGQFIANPEKYINEEDKDKEIYITCNSGNSAGLTTNILKGMGYNANNIEGGMNPLVKEFVTNV